MNANSLIILVFSIVLLIYKFLEGFNSKEPIKESENKSRPEFKSHQVQYNYSNNKLVKGSLLSHYQELLRISEEPEINLDVIYINYIDVLEETESFINIGIAPRHDVYDLISAREYMNEMVKYYGNLN